jgi:hypothetical protein
VDAESAVAAWAAEVKRRGFAVVPGVFAAAEIEAMTIDLTRVLAEPREATFIRSRESHVYAARNLLELWPPTSTVWRRRPLPDLLRAVLGPRFGLVRCLFFDKPPEQSWSLPWHKDLTIAVREHVPGSGRFTKPTRKAGVPHVEAPQEVLDQMLTLRIHLDDITEKNGPMNAIPGSHRTGKEMCIDEKLAHRILVRRGDVLAIRPLVAHNSISSQPDNTRHRRILHLEFAASPELSGGYRWHTFLAA